MTKSEIAPAPSGIVAREAARAKQVAMAMQKFSNAAMSPKFHGIIDLESWAYSLLTNAEYKEPDPEYLQTQMLLRAAMSETPEELLSEGGMDGLQKLVPDAPFATTGPIEIFGVYVARSNLSDGAKTYCLLEYMNLETNDIGATTTGAKMVQMDICRFLSWGNDAIRCQIMRSERKDKGGRHLFNIRPID